MIDHGARKRLFIASARKLLAACSMAANGNSFRSKFMVEAYPLYWPEGWKRTLSWQRTHSRFKIGFATSRDFLIAEVKRLGGTQIILSTNVRLRGDGLPYASEREPEDGGAAVYFTYKKNPMCFACDRYKTVKENLTAIGKTIEALRGMERWGASDMMERAFRGFAQLPDKTGRDWWDVLQVRRDSSREVIEANFRRLAIDRHPDHGGSSDAMSELNQARAHALTEISGRA
jgi:hypothetical protein